MSQFWNGEVLAAPNLITVCVDESQASEISGRLYHGYSQEPPDRSQKPCHKP